MVLLKNHTGTGKLRPKWIGPFPITCVHDNENVSIKRGKKETRIHINELKIHSH